MENNPVRHMRINAFGVEDTEGSTDYIRKLVDVDLKNLESDSFKFIAELKPTIFSSTALEEKQQILNLLPNFAKIQSEFKCKQYSASKAKTMHEMAIKK